MISLDLIVPVTRILQECVEIFDPIVSLSHSYYITFSVWNTSACHDVS